MKINALEQVAVPLPHSSEGWRLQQVLLDDQPAHALKTDDQGKLWLLVEKGQHEIIMLGSVAQQTQFSLSFALLLISALRLAFLPLAVSLTSIGLDSP